MACTWSSMEPCRFCTRDLSRLFFSAVLLSLCAPLLYAQDIQIRVLNAQNGKPIGHECVNVSLGSWHGADLLVPTDKNGIVVLHLRGNEVMVDAACQGWPKQARTANLATIALIGDSYVACQEYGKFAPEERPAPEAVAPVGKEIVPTYSIKAILRTGVVASNTCGKFRAKAKPGELIFFERPRSFWERLRQ